MQDYDDDQPRHDFKRYTHSPSSSARAFSDTQGLPPVINQYQPPASTSAQAANQTLTARGTEVIAGKEARYREKR